MTSGDWVTAFVSHLIRFGGSKAERVALARTGASLYAKDPTSDPLEAALDEFRPSGKTWRLRGRSPLPTDRSGPGLRSSEPTLAELRNQPARPARG